MYDERLDPANGVHGLFLCKKLFKSREILLKINKNKQGPGSGDKAGQRQRIYSEFLLSHVYVSLKM
jgi:hypothetical protein